MCISHYQGVAKLKPLVSFKLVPTEPRQNGWNRDKTSKTSNHNAKKAVLNYEKSYSLHSPSYLQTVILFQNTSNYKYFFPIKQLSHLWLFLDWVKLLPINYCQPNALVRNCYCQLVPCFYFPCKIHLLSKCTLNFGPLIYKQLHSYNEQEVGFKFRFRHTTAYYPPKKRLNKDSIYLVHYYGYRLIATIWYLSGKKEEKKNSLVRK